MTPPESKQSPSLVGQILRTPAEITRVLNSLVARSEPIVCDLSGGELVFRSRLRFADPACTYLEIDFSPSEAANRALLAQARATFHAEPSGWRVEFAAAEPKAIAASEGAPGIRLRFPEIVAGHRLRESERIETRSQCELRCVADEAGLMAFDGTIANISRGGIGFLHYDPAIILEPGTLLRGCRIDSPGGESVVVDMEVRYSQLVTLPDGRRVRSSGCRFVHLSAEEAARIETLFGLEP